MKAYFMFIENIGTALNLALHTYMRLNFTNKNRQTFLRNKTDGSFGKVKTNKNFGQIQLNENFGKVKPIEILEKQKPMATMFQQRSLTRIFSESSRNFQFYNGVNFPRFRPQKSPFQKKTNAFNETFLHFHQFQL